MIDLTTNRFRTDSQKKLLLIEDDASVVESLSLLLKTDYEVHSESTVASGVRRLHDLQPALVILDLRLPDGEGLEVLRGIRRDDMHMPVVILTGYASMRTVEESLRLGAVDYLHKPFDGFELKSRIGQLLSTHGVRKSAEQTALQKLEGAQREIATLKLKADAAAMFLHDAASPVTTGLTAAHYLCALVEKCHSTNEDALGMTQLLMNAMGFLSSLFKQTSYLECLNSLPISSIEVRKVVEIAISLVKAKAKRRNVIVGLQLKKPDAVIPVNRFALARVLLNLLQNAIEAVQPETGCVTLIADCVDGFAEFSVLDNGPGIPPDMQERVFEQRFTTKTEGCGLGLYISKQLVSGMGGDLTLRSESGHGCCFSIKLPLIL